MKFGEKIKLIRKKAGLTQRELASRLGVSPASIQNYEYGKTIPSAGTISKLSEELNLHYSIFGSEENDDLLPVFNVYDFEEGCEYINRVINERIDMLNNSKQTLADKYTGIFRSDFVTELGRLKGETEELREETERLSHPATVPLDEMTTYQEFQPGIWGTGKAFRTIDWIYFYCNQLNENALEKVFQLAHDLAGDRENLNDEFLKKLKK